MIKTGSTYIYDCLDKNNGQAPEKARKAMRGDKMITAVCDVGKRGFKPNKAHEDDAGYDMRCPEDVYIPKRGSRAIDLDVSVLIPRGFVGMLKSKSGLNVKHGLRGEGVIDAGYTGSIVAKIYNDSDLDYYVSRGDKIIQLVIMPIAEVELVDGEMPETDRGANGFGSSGK